jgi:hypothetical protein
MSIVATISLTIIILMSLHDTIYYYKETKKTERETEKSRVEFNNWADKYLKDKEQR